MSDDLTLVEILREDDTLSSMADAHDAIAARLASIVGPDRSSGRFDLQIAAMPPTESLQSFRRAVSAAQKREKYHLLTGRYGWARFTIQSELSGLGASPS